MIKKILDLIYFSVKSEGGDGDAIWLSKHVTIEFLFPIIEKYNKENNINWVIEKQEKCIAWGIEQEWAIITNDKDFFKSQPDYIILKIDY